ncbi:MAG: ABC transporter permease [Alphaproteobacteria bacterium]|nr:ABC transporter permease [Alphaproteobacteria bacterium]
MSAAQTEAAGGTSRWPASLLAGVAIVLAWLLVAGLGPSFSPHDPIAVDLANALVPPGSDHVLGTDSFGRDILTRIVHGARIDLMMAFFGVVGPFLLGTMVGLVAGNFGGVADAVLMRILDVTVSFPYFVLVIAIVAVLEPGLTSYFVSLTLVNWVSYARLVRSEVLVLREADFVLAARLIGVGEVRVMSHHLLPNAITPAVVFVFTDAVLTIVLGSSLGFLGLGVQPPAAEWGVMIAEGQLYLATAWWICVFPGLAIATLAFGFSLIADGLAKQLHTAP